jgi:hypothetical protein
MGLLFHLGIAYNDLISFVSLLAMAIGVDNSFVILDGWRRHLHIRDQVGFFLLIVIVAYHLINKISNTKIM